MADTAITLGTLIGDGAAVLAASRISDPRREALRIWGALNGLSVAATVLDRDMAIGSLPAASFIDAVTRRATGEPLAYVTGWTGFRKLTLRADRRGLIPRPETEGLVEHVLARVRHGRVADVGTGSGCVALSLAHEGEYSLVVAVDCSAGALALAAANAAATGQRVALVRGDLCAPLARLAFDALVSNPPYLTDREHTALDSSVRDWEPEAALRGGSDGLSATFRLLDEGRAVVRAGGWIALEVDCSRAAAAAGRAVELGWDAVAVHADLFGRERYLLARRSDAL